MRGRFTKMYYDVYTKAQSWKMVLCADVHCFGG